MKILNLFNSAKKIINGVWEETIDENEKYKVSIINLADGLETEIYGDPNLIQTFYILDGQLQAKVFLDGQEVGTKIFIKDQGWTLLPEQTQQLKAKGDVVAYLVSGRVLGKSIADKTGRSPINPKVINEIKEYFVSKPWGSEKWFVENGIYVLKGITMNAGTECSLQLHEQKVEVNLIVSGRCRLTLGFSEEAQEAIINHRALGNEQSTFSLPEERITEIKSQLKSTIISQAEGWKVKPFEIHQVLSLDTYYALEVSSPEVDDIIRLKDLYNRPGGRILNEHNSK